MELRCNSRLHGILVEEGRIEVKCRSKHCGAKAEVTVLHYFNILTGELIETKRFKDPQTVFNQQEEKAQCR